MKTVRGFPHGKGASCLLACGIAESAQAEELLVMMKSYQESKDSRILEAA